MTSTAFILGGYGGAGAASARLLLRETPLQLVLAGRDGGRAAAVAAGLDDEFGGGRVRSLGVDATDSAALGEALKSCDLAIVCMPLEGMASGVAEAVLRANVDWLDISLGPLKQQTLLEMAPDIERSGRCFITEAGAIPGLPSVLVRLAAGHFERLHSGAVSAIIKESELALGSALDIVRQVADQASVYEDGAWRAAAITGIRRFDFGEPFGQRSCSPVEMVEMRDLPARLGIERLGTYGAGVNPIVDLMLVAFAFAKLGRVKKAVDLCAKFMVWANRQFTKPPYGVQIKLEAEETIDDSPTRLDVSLGHVDGYEITAIPLVACVLQLLDDSIRRPGLHYMGSAVDPVRLLGDMRRLGLTARGL